MNEWLEYEKNRQLIGKRATFLTPESYVASAHNQKGTIMHHKGSKWISLKFDKPLKSGFAGSMKTETLFIRPKSYRLLRKRKKPSNAKRLVTLHRRL